MVCKVLHILDGCVLENHKITGGLVEDVSRFQAGVRLEHAGWVRRGCLGDKLKVCVSAAFWWTITGVRLEHAGWVRRGCWEASFLYASAGSWWSITGVQAGKAVGEGALEVLFDRAF